MNYRVELFPAAIKEMDESAYWYEKCVDGLGEDFINIVYKSFGVIALNPLAYPKKKSYREFLVKKFPYLIIYEISEKKRVINVLHVFHSSRNPKFKYKKQ
jgi:mRNA-degrading endonuclease RelE of RelBE toxin-antitoxin system